MACFRVEIDKHQVAKYLTPVRHIFDLEIFYEFTAASLEQCAVQQGEIGASD